MTDNGSDLTVVLEFGGGAEQLFNKSKKHIVRLSGNQKPWTIRKLLLWLKNNLLTGNAELFFQGDTVRPGILVLINETDWELVGTLNYEIMNYDCVMFLSTLHGG